MKINFPFVPYNKYIIQSHIFEKIISHFILEDVDHLCTVDFECVHCAYTYGSIRHMKPRALFIHLLHAFFLEKITCLLPINCTAYMSIADFKISRGQLMGYTITLRQKDMHSFIYNYFYNVITAEKNFKGIAVFSKSLYIEKLSFSIGSLYNFLQISQMFDNINQFIPNLQSSFYINIFFSTKDISLITLYLSHLQILLHRMHYELHTGTPNVCQVINYM